MKRLILLAVIFLVLVSPASLQEECDSSAVAAAIQGQLAQLAADPAATLTEIAHLAMQGASDCGDGHHAFSGDEGYPQALGPMTLPAGLYIFTMTTEGTARLLPYALSEDCGRDLTSSIFSTREGESSRGAQHLVRVESDCELFLQLENMTLEAAWSLDIGRVR